MSTRRGQVCCWSLFAVMIGSGRTALSSTQFYADRAVWEAAVIANGLSVTNFPFTPANLALSDELVGPPAQNVLFGSVLTFPSSSTGLPFSFALSSFEPNTEMMSWSLYGPENLAIDSTGSFPFDDGRDAWDMELTGSSVVAFGFDIIDNDFNLNDAERLNAYGCGNALLGSAPLPGSPPGSGVDDARFIGVISDTPIQRVFINESPTDNDNTGMKGFAFAVSVVDCNAVPTVSEWGLVSMSLLGLVTGTLMFARRRALNG